MKNLLFFFSFLFLFVASAQAMQQNLDYCELQQNCTVGDFVYFDNGSQVNVDACCNASVYYPNQTVFFENQSMTVSSFGFHNSSFNSSTTGYHKVLMACNCSTEFQFQSLDALVVNSSTININFSGINITGQALTTEQNQTLFDSANFSNVTMNQTNSTYFNTLTIVDNTDPAPLMALFAFLALSGLFLFLAMRLVQFGPFGQLFFALISFAFAVLGLLVAPLYSTNATTNEFMLNIYAVMQVLVQGAGLLAVVLLTKFLMDILAEQTLKLGKK